VLAVGRSAARSRTGPGVTPKTSLSSSTGDDSGIDEKQVPSQGLLSCVQAAIAHASATPGPFDPCGSMATGR
jgi:hypothetical protein